MKCEQCDSTDTTIYVTQGSAQYSCSSPLACGINGSSAWAEPLRSYGALCDEHARAAGLWPTAFGRDLSPVGTDEDGAK